MAARPPRGHRPRRRTSWKSPTRSSCSRRLSRRPTDDPAAALALYEAEAAAAEGGRKGALLLEVARLRELAPAPRRRRRFARGARAGARGVRHRPRLGARPLAAAPAAGARRRLGGAGGDLRTGDPGPVVRGRSAAARRAADRPRAVAGGSAGPRGRRGRLLPGSAGGGARSPGRAAVAVARRRAAAGSGALRRGAGRARPPRRDPRRAGGAGHRGGARLAARRAARRCGARARRAGGGARPQRRRVAARGAAGRARGARARRRPRGDRGARARGSRQAPGERRRGPGRRAPARAGPSAAPGAAGARGGARGARRGGSPRSRRTRWWRPSGSSWRWPSIAAMRPPRSRAAFLARGGARRRGGRLRARLRRGDLRSRPPRRGRRDSADAAGAGLPAGPGRSARARAGAGRRPAGPAGAGRCLRRRERTPRRTPTPGRRSRALIAAGGGPGGTARADRRRQPISTGARSIAAVARAGAAGVAGARLAAGGRRSHRGGGGDSGGGAGGAVLVRTRRRAKRTPPSRSGRANRWSPSTPTSWGRPAARCRTSAAWWRMQPQELARRVRLCDLDLESGPDGLARRASAPTTCSRWRPGPAIRRWRSRCGSRPGGRSPIRRSRGRLPRGWRCSARSAAVDPSGLAAAALERAATSPAARAEIVAAELGVRGRERPGGADAGAPFPAGAPPRGGGRFRRSDGRVDAAPLRGRSAGARLELRAGAPRGRRVPGGRRALRGDARARRRARRRGGRAARARRGAGRGG